MTRQPAEELLAGTGVRGGGGGEAGYYELHGREEARSGELGDDEVVAARNGAGDGVKEVVESRKRRSAAVGSGSRRRAAARW
nr:unnamed protein product [Digitaria exilis]